MKLNRYRFSRKDPKRGQAFLELALILPVLLIMLIGMVEVVFFIGRYLDVLDLTREAARFASQRDPQIKEIVANDEAHQPGDLICNPDPLIDDKNSFNFFYDTACIFSPTGGPSCWDEEFCNGLNPFMLLNPASDDVIVTVFTISHNQVTNTWPMNNPLGNGKYWALSNHDNYTESDPMKPNGDNWTRDCQGNTVRSEPHYTATSIQNQLLAYGPNVPDAKGYVAVEFFYCYNQVLNLPLITQFIPNPFQIHAYTIMPLPFGSPTPTPTSP
jgi:hypothetical protein